VEPDPAPPDLARLARIRADRTRLDERELELIERARQQGASWTRIAAALGLASRQAAQQRRQRLLAARRSRRRDLDLEYAPRLVELRHAIADLHRWIGADRRWESRFTRAGLVRATAGAALDAAPGALYALATHVATDLAGVRPVLPRPVRIIAVRLDRALSTRD
jgi:hypothetical protein